MTESDGLKILVVGGYGIFGGRLVDLLRDDARLTFLVAGRSLPKAQAFCLARNDSQARLEPVLFDRQGDLLGQLASLAPDLCVDASGPFQKYGAGAYGLVEACIARHIDYLDLADGSDFVTGVSGFDEAARAAGIFVLSGVSSFPVLTAAVTRRLAAGLESVTSIRGGIAPSPYAGVGENVIRAIASYAGRPVAMRRGGENVTGYPFTETMRFIIAPPGRVPLRRTLFSLVDVPDLRELPRMWPSASTVWMGAGPVPELLHRALIALSWLVRWRLLPSLSPLAPLMFRLTNRLRWGEHRGGMFVELDGVLATGESLTRSWHLLAEGDDGPLIPSMAVEALIRQALAGKRPASGARPALHEVELDDYEALFVRRTIYVGEREDTPKSRLSLYRRVLGSAWEGLPPELREIHDGRVKVVNGRASVQRGPGLLSKLAATLFRFPKSGGDLPLVVRFKAEREGETWTRTFGEQSFSSWLREGHGAAGRLLCECFGPFAFAQALVVEGDTLRRVMRSWTVFGLPLPLWLAPSSNSHATVHEGRYRFFVDLSHPLTGPIIRYDGWLAKLDDSALSACERTAKTV